MPLTKLLAYDHQPYSSNASGMPDAIANAARLGTVRWLDDIDLRQLEWQDVDPELRKSHASR